ncbi:MAG: YihY/virulence factor BrkB family protein [Acidimicrobiales bacterium]
MVESAHDRITLIAASLAFHGFLALLPILIAGVGLLGLVGLSPSTLHHLLHATSVLLPTQMSSILNQQLTGPPSSQVNLTELVVGLLVALWSSVEAMAAIQVALDVAYEVPRDRGFFGRRVAAIPLIGITVVLGGVASVLLILGHPIARLLPAGLSTPLVVVRYGGSLVLVMLLLSAYYSLGPAHRKFRWEWVSPGSVVAAIGWVASALGFSFYLDHFGHESRTYGALAGVAVTLLWMFLTATIVLFGAEVNRELERLAEGSPSQTVGDETQRAVS